MGTHPFCINGVATSVLIFGGLSVISSLFLFSFINGFSRLLGVFIPRRKVSVICLVASDWHERRVVCLHHEAGLRR